MARLEEILLRITAEDNADAAIDKLIAKLDDLSHKHVNIPIRVDEHGAAAIDRLKANLDSLHNKTVDVKVDTESSGFSRLRQEAQSAEKSVEGIKFHAAGLKPVLAAAAPALLPFVGTLLQATLGAGALGVAAGGATLAFGALAYGMEYAAKHGSGAVKQAADEMKKSFVDVRTTILQSMTGAFEGVAAGMTSMLQSIRPALAGLKSSWTVLGSAIRAALDDPAIQGAVQQLISDFGRLVRATAPIAGPLIQAFVQLGDVLINIARAAMPSLIPLVRDLANWLARINATAQTGQLQATIHRWIDEFLQVGRVVVGLVKDLAPLLQSGGAASGILTLVGAVGKLVGAFLNLLNKMGPVGQLIASGLGIALLLSKFSLLTPALNGIIALFNALKAAVIGADVAQAAPVVSGFGRVGTTVAEDAGKAEGAGFLAGLLASAKGIGGRFIAVVAEGIAAGGAAVATAVGAVFVLVGGGLLYIAHRWGSMLVQGLNSGISAAAHAVVGAMTAVFGAVTGAVRAARGAVMTAARAVFNGVATAARAVVGAVRTAATFLIHGAVTVVRGAVGAMRSAAVAVWHAIEAAGRAVLGAVKAAAEFVIHGAISAVRGLLGAMRSAAAAVWNAITQALHAIFGAVVGAARAVIRAAAGAIRGLLSAVSSAASAVWHTIVSTIQAIVQTVVGVAKSIVSGVASAIRAGAQAVGSAASAVWHAITSVFSGALNWAFQAGKNIVNAIANGISSAVNAVVGAAKSVFDAIKSLSPFSEPKDTSSPLYGLARAGRAIVGNIATGMSSMAPEFRRAFTQAVQLPALPTGMVHLGAMSAVGRGGTTHHHAGIHITNIFNVETMHPTDPKTLREISNVVSIAQRRSFSQRPPVRA